MKIGILLFGVLGLVSLFVPIEGTSMFSMAMAGPKVDLVIILVGFGLPTAMAALGLLKPPFQAWQGIASLAGFALLAIKTHLWEALPHIMDLPLPLKLFVIAPVGGIITSAIAIAKPDRV